ncbi:MAG: hypothetical protein QW303_06455 [Nitrososphaerota archaeon]
MNICFYCKFWWNNSCKEGCEPENEGEVIWCEGFIHGKDATRTFER